MEFEAVPTSKVEVCLTTSEVSKALPPLLGDFSSVMWFHCTKVGDFVLIFQPFAFVVAIFFEKLEMVALFAKMSQRIAVGNYLAFASLLEPFDDDD